MSRFPFFEYHGDELHAEEVALSRIAAAFGTPVYVYSRAALVASWEGFTRELAGRDAMVCYAMKANSNLAVLNLFAQMGSGFDIVSGGELKRVIAAGGDPAKVIFSGVGKSEHEISLALSHGIYCFNIESASELDRVARIATACGAVAPISIRVNPDVDAGTHPYISTGLKENKFGVEVDAAVALYRRAATQAGVRIVGVDCHIGSQLTDPAPLFETLDRMLVLIDTLADSDIRINHLDLGGGLGIRYKDEIAPDPGAYMREIVRRVGTRRLKLMFEPGRNLVGNAGVLLTRVEVLKNTAVRNFAVVDAAMNDLLRPSLYSAHHDILAVTLSQGVRAAYDVVGPVCESADFLGKDRILAVGEGDLLAVMSAGAYGMVMASNYNTRPRAAEVMVSGNRFDLVREREQVESLYALERIPP